MRGEFDIVLDFYNDVCRLAEKKMMATGKLEGTHYAAMKEVLERRRADIIVENGHIAQQTNGGISLNG